MAEDWADKKAKELHNYFLRTALIPLVPLIAKGLRECRAEGYAAAIAACSKNIMQLVKNDQATAKAEWKKGNDALADIYFTCSGTLMKASDAILSLKDNLPQNAAHRSDTKPQG